MWPVRMALDAEFLTLQSSRWLGCHLAQSQLLRFHQLVILPSQRVKRRHRVILAQSLQRKSILTTAIVQGGVEAAPQISVVRLVVRLKLRVGFPLAVQVALLHKGLVSTIIQMRNHLVFGFDAFAACRRLVNVLLILLNIIVTSVYSDARLSREAHA